MATAAGRHARARAMAKRGASAAAASGADDGNPVDERGGMLKLNEPPQSIGTHADPMTSNYPNVFESPDPDLSNRLKNIHVADMSTQPILQSKATGSASAPSMQQGAMFDPREKLLRMVHAERYATHTKDGYAWYRCHCCKRWFRAPKEDRGDIVTVGGCAWTTARVPWHGEEEWIKQWSYEQSHSQGSRQSEAR